MFGDTRTQNWILAQGVCLRTLQMHIFMPRMSKTQLHFVLLHLGGHLSLLCTKPMEPSCSAEAMKSRQLCSDSTQCAMRCYFRFCIWNIKEEGYRNVCFLWLCYPCYVVSRFACFWHADISQPTVNRKSPRITVFTFRCGTHIAHNQMAASQKHVVVPKFDCAVWKLPLTFLIPAICYQLHVTSLALCSQQSI